MGTREEPGRSRRSRRCGRGPARARDEATIGFADTDFATRIVYTDPGPPDDVLVYRGWSSPADLTAYRTARWPAIVAELGRLGVTGTYFSGYTRLALDGSPEPPIEAHP